MLATGIARGGVHGWTVVEHPGTVLTVPGVPACLTCGRDIHEQGEVHVIESALDNRGGAPASQYISALLLSRRRADQDAVADIAVRLRDYAQTGTLEVPRELNTLVPGEIWEIKAGVHRFPFYVPEPGCGDVRLTHGFRKGTKPTPLKEIDRARAIAREDKKR